MDDLTRLRVRYGLPPDEPTDDQFREFVRHYDQLRSAGIDDEEAGRRAAQKSFPGYRTHKYGAISTSPVDATIARLRAALGGQPATKK